MTTYSHADVDNAVHRKSRWSVLVGWLVIASFVCFYGFALKQNSTLWSQSSDVLIMVGANYAPLTLYGQEWRLFTHIFIHSNVFHLLVNALAFFFVWRRSAMVFHVGTQLYIFLGCGFIAGWVGAAYQFSAVSVGASSAILGLLASVVGWSIARNYIGHDIKKTIARFPAIVVSVVMTASFLLPGMSVYANLGGIVAGLLFGIFSSSKSEKEHGAIAATALMGVTVALFCGAMVFARPSEEKTLRVLRDRVAEKVIENIHETDKNVEDTMNTLWGTENPEANKAVNVASNEQAWRVQWQLQVVQPLERNAAVAASTPNKSNDLYFSHLNLLQQYTASRLQEARLLELGHEQANTSTSAMVLRQRIIELSSQMKTLSERKPDTAGSKKLLKVGYHK